VAFYLLRYVEAQLSGACIGSLRSIDKYPQLAPRLNGVTLINAVKTQSKLFKFFESLDILFHHLPSCTWSCTADRITRLNNRRDNVCHFDFVVVSTDSIANDRMLLVFLR